MIDKTAIIHNDAVVAEDAVIGPFCNIGKDVIILAGCILESNVILKGHTTLLQNVHIFSFTNIGQDDSKITIGQDTTIREFVQLDTFANNSKEISIGHENFIMAYVQIFGGVEMGDKCTITNAVRINEDVSCGNSVIIGGLSTIESGNKIGDGVMIGGASYVSHDVPPFCLVEGNKSSLKGLNLVGLRRRFDDAVVIDEIKLAYKRLLNGKADKNAAKKLSQESSNVYVKQFADFISHSNLS